MLEASPLGQAKMTLNICDYLGTSSIWCGVFVRFCSTTYELNKSGMDKLRTDVETAARESGLEIVLRTSSEKLIGKGRECMSLVCSCSRLHSPTTTQVHNHENDEDDKENAKIGTKQEATGHKITVLHNARKANRKGGKSAVRKRDTKRRTDSTEPRCPFLRAIERLYDVVSETAKDIGCEPPTGQVVSSCLAKSKRRRTHGTDHWKK
jgi:hypothetical protein